MVAPTKVRAGRVSALLAGFQSARGTPVSDFTTAATKRLWTSSASIDYAPAKREPDSMIETASPASGVTEEERQRRGMIEAIATPSSLEWILRSSWGPLSAGSFAFKSAVNEWLTLGYVENVLAGATEYFARIYDAWINRVILAANREIGSTLSKLMIFADYAAERTAAPVALNALGGITLPSPPMEPDSKKIFPGRLVRLFRDPAGANQEIDLHEIEVEVDQGITGGDWDQLRQVPGVIKQGFPGPRVRVRFVAHLSDETWTILNNARAGTRQKYRITATNEESPAKVLTLDLFEVDFEIEQIGHEGREARLFEGWGEAHIDDSGNFVSISLA